MSREYIVPIFIPHAGCKKICVFCNEYSATGIKLKPNIEELNATFYRYIKYFPQNKKTYIAFYGSTFTGMSNIQMQFYLDWAQEKINNSESYGIRFSTSPEEITEEKIEILRKYDINFIEIGVQSFFDDVLKAANRPHDLEDVWNAIELLEKNNIDYGIHLMTGLPKSTYNKDINSAMITTLLKAKSVRIHPTVILKNSTLEKMYKNKEYIPESLDEAVEKVSKMTEIIEASGKKVIRLGICLYGKERENVVVGPYHDSFGDLIRTKIAEDIIIFFEELKVPIKFKSNFIGFKRKNSKLLEKSKIEFHNEEYFIYKNEKFEYSDILNKLVENIEKK
ncbi:Radical_SAM C-terminal domain-containing protein [Marinitoga hydrogenitolerans DSM 16785]|uniref:Radical_SAM C-terminal domain-containing protein n=1 Tax=Marinitoga hydrogenitolerans (strain DSM 16785 / JCM 12826 / AT1271) TaxID=1122195 RepID=A0A1M4SWT5_MARH1|nr:radical SAM protein [Marinitoga hydrogenitolerans]SHE36608.1 Radical_SAM C-terminal domain-containing protein [Marinitoga hydrogenitolerans DSM 16785]